jgi:hypothetical protein
MSLEKDLGQVRRLYEARAMELSGYKRDVREQKQLQEAEASKAANVRWPLMFFSCFDLSARSSSFL